MQGLGAGRNRMMSYNASDNCEYIHGHQTEGLDREYYSQGGYYLYSGSVQSHPLAEKNLYPKMMIYYDHNTGERRHDVDAVRRFFRLRWGGWIRPRRGRDKRLWRKPDHIRWWTRQHVLCDEQQTAYLEKLITPNFKKTRHFIDDPYEPYHKRHGIDVLPATVTRKSTSYFKLIDEYWLNKSSVEAVPRVLFVPNGNFLGERERESCWYTRSHQLL